MTTEHRKFPRAPHSCEAKYRLYGLLTEGWVTITVLNISAGGVRFRAAEQLEPGTVLEVQLQLPADPAPLVIMGRVIWSRMPAAGVAEIGTAFLSVTPEQSVRIDDLVRFLKSRSPAPG